MYGRGGTRARGLPEPLAGPHRILACWPASFCLGATGFISDHVGGRDPRSSRGVEELAEMAGVSARTLQTAFRRFRNTTPMTHLREVRLELARTELARAQRNSGSVASIAHLCGFGHLGRFATDYKARFNESPSQTLLRGSIGRLRPSVGNWRISPGRK